MFDNLPHELRAYRQWIVWREETTPEGRTTKLPYDPHTGRHASVTAPATWSTFDHVVAIARANPGWGIGFVLTDNDPYTIIDLDDPYALKPDGTNKHRDPATVAQLAQQICEAFQSYAEVSPSGKGLHIIVKGRVPTGRRRWGAEVYSTERYMTMTGNVWRPLGIVEHQAALDSLYQHLGGDPEVYTAQATYEDKYPDQDILARAANAENGAKFMDLYNGNWQSYYPSQSEADFALINILAFYTTSYFQIERLFKQSGLGQREKANRGKYVEGMIKRAFDRMPPPIDMDGIRTALEASYARQQEKALDHGGQGQGGAFAREETQSPELGDHHATGNVPPSAGQSNPYLAPVPGAVGEIARFVYEQAPRPVPELAVAAALALMAGIAGRAYNVSNTGLNQYILALAPTGRGKEAITSGITSLMHHVTGIGPGMGNCPGAKEFLGPERISSGQALVKYVDKTSKSFVSLQGEFDGTLKQMAGRFASSAQIALKQSLLQFYSRSGRGQVMQPTIYSDRDKNTAPIEAPAVTLIGEGTPERFYELLDEGLVADGLLPRFTIIEYNGPRPEFNRDHAHVKPSSELVHFMTQLAGYCLMLNQSNTVIDVGFDADGKAAMDGFDKEVDAHINSANNETIAELWNRAHLKALKIAATIAVGINAQTPTITGELAQWAINAVKYDTSRLVHKFASGDIGDGEGKQLVHVREAIKRYLSEKRLPPSYKVNPALHRDKIIPWRFIQSQCVGFAAFKNDRQGATNAVKRCMQTLMDAGYVQLVRADQLVQYGRVNGNCYMVVDPLYLAD